MKKKILFCDLDGVVADFEKEMNKKIPGWRQMTEKEVDEKVTEMCLNDPNIFHNLDPIPNAVETVKKLFNHFEVYFLSTPMWKSPESFTGKRLWVEEHFGDLAIKRLILSHRKDLNIGDYLIDDRTHNGAGEFTGKHIHYGTVDFPDWDSVYEFLKEENPFIVPDEDVKVLVSNCKKCGNIVTMKVEHINENDDFYDEVEKHDLEAVTLPLLEVRAMNTPFCECIKGNIQIRVIEHNDNEGETFTYLLNVSPEIGKKLKDYVDRVYDESEWAVNLDVNYDRQKVDELNEHVNNDYLEYIEFYEFTDPSDLDNIDSDDFDFEGIFYKSSGLTQVV